VLLPDAIVPLLTATFYRLTDRPSYVKPLPQAQSRNHALPLILCQVRRRQGNPQIGTCSGCGPGQPPFTARGHLLV